MSPVRTPVTSDLHVIVDVRARSDKVRPLTRRLQAGDLVDALIRRSGTGGRDHGAVQRVAVVGPGGAGKSTFAAELGRRTRLPVVHLDRHYWKPGWVETPKDEWRRVQAELLAGDDWIVDGNYGGTFDVRFERADTVIVIQPSPLVCLAGALRRSMGSRGKDIQAPGCPERLDRAFLRWIWRYRRDSRPRLDAALDRYRSHLDIIELTSRRQASAFLRRVAEPGCPEPA